MKEIWAVYLFPCAYFNTGGANRIPHFANKDIPADVELVGLFASHVRHLTEVSPDLYKEPQSKVRSFFRKKLKEWSYEEKKRNYEIIIPLLSKEPSDEDMQENLAELKALFPEKIEFVELSLEKWRSEKAPYIDESASSHTLFLFDLDMSKESEVGGTKESGMEEIRFLVGGESKRLTHMCGILTHPTQPDEQEKKRLELANSSGVDCDKFIVISKTQISKPELLARDLKTLALLSDFNKMKEKINEIFDSSIKKAHDSIANICSSDFEHIIFHATREEGAWEPDTLFRIFSVHHRKHVQTSIYHELAATAEKIRSVTDLFKEVPSCPTEAAVQLRQDELYEHGEIINEFFLPIELGDIFEIKPGGASKSKQYILLAQPCDLAIRPNGQRGRDEYLTLARIEPPAKNSCRFYRKNEKCYLKHGTDDKCRMRSNSPCEDFERLCPVPLFSDTSNHVIMNEKRKEGG